jgi:hypothetical protein
VPAGDEERLDVEGPAGERQARKYILRGEGGEAFETALRVLQAGQHQQ